MEKITFADRIELNPRVCNGKLVITGTRIPVTVILDQIADDESWEAVIESFPELSREDIQAVLHYAKASLENTEVGA